MAQESLDNHRKRETKHQNQKIAMSEDTLRKTEIHEVIKRSYTTEVKKWPKRRRKLETVRERCEDLLELQWPMKEVGYDKLKMDMITKLGLCDRTTLVAYLGRIDSSVYSGRLPSPSPHISLHWNLKVRGNDP